MPESIRNPPWRGCRNQEVQAHYATVRTEEGEGARRAKMLNHLDRQVIFQVGFSKQPVFVDEIGFGFVAEATDVFHAPSAAPRSESTVPSLHLMLRPSPAALPPQTGSPTCHRRPVLFCHPMRQGRIVDSFAPREHRHRQPAALCEASGSPSSRLHKQATMHVRLVAGAMILARDREKGC